MADDEFDLTELNQPLPEKEEPKQEAPKEEKVPEPPKAEAPKAETPKKEVGHPPVDSVNSNPLNYFIPEMGKVEKSLEDASKTGGSTHTGSVSFNGGDWSATGDWHAFIARSTGGHLNITIDPSGVFAMVRTVDQNYEKEAPQAGGHVLHPLRILPKIFDNISSRLADLAGSKVGTLSLKSPDLGNFPEVYATATGETRRKVEEKSAKPEDKKKHPKEKEEKKPKPDSILYNFFLLVSKDKWKTHGEGNSKIVYALLSPEEFKPIEEIVSSKKSGQVESFYYKITEQGNLYIVDMASSRKSSLNVEAVEVNWAGPSLANVGALVGMPAAKWASEMVSDLAGKFNLNFPKFPSI
jgi:hypothetical protein